MPALIVRLSGRENAAFSPLMAAAFTVRVARRLKMDRIRVERLDGALVSEYTTDAVERAINRFGPTTPIRVAQPGWDYEPHRPVWAAGRKESATWQRAT